MAAGMTTTNFPVAALGPLVGGSCVWAASYCANIDRAFCTIDVLALALPVFVAAVVPQPGSIPARARIAIATAGRLLTFGLTICLAKWSRYLVDITPHGIAVGLRTCQGEVVPSTAGLKP